MEKKTLLIGSNKSLSSRFTVHTLCDIGRSYYEKYKDEYEVIFVTRYNNVNRAYNTILRVNRSPFYDKIITSKDHVKDVNYSADGNWTLYQEQMNIDDIPKIDKIIEIGSGLSTLGGLRRDESTRDSMFNTNDHYKFLTGYRIREYFMFMTKILKRDDCQLIHHIIDPQEMDYNTIFEPSEINYVRHFPYSSARYNFERSDMFLDTYRNNWSFDVDKTYDFIFGYTVLTDDRCGNLYDLLVSKLSDFKIEILLRDNKKDIDTFVNKDVYISKLRRSKFTLIIPAYENDTFSAFRYIEAIYNNCLPLILDTNQLDEVRKSLYIPDEIIVNIDDIANQLNKLDVDKIIKDIKANIVR